MSYYLSKEEYDACFEIEAQMLSQDKLIQETLFFKNELESRIYDYREKLGSTWAIYTNNQTGMQFMLEKRINWLYDEGTDAKKS